ncbi:MAG TPA: DUF2842 domain-containing protein [Tepidisphaeraceae bacterium]|jgi:hypothetical protein
MSIRAKRAVTVLLGAVGIIFMLAMSFHMLPDNQAMFWACACFVLSGLVWAFPSGADE